MCKPFLVKFAPVYAGFGGFAQAGGLDSVWGAARKATTNAEDAEENQLLTAGYQASTD